MLRFQINPQKEWSLVLLKATCVSFRRLHLASLIHYKVKFHEGAATVWGREAWGRECHHVLSGLRKMPCMYNSLTRECPWAEHLTSLPKRGVGALLSVSAFTTKECPCHAYMPLKQIIGPTITYVQQNHQRLWSRVLMAHITLNDTMSPQAWCSLRCTN